MTLPSVDILAQALVERYDVVREIGRGGMGGIYLAEDRRHGRPVAIKVMLPDLTATLGAERFLREIRLLARLQHPHILPLYDSGETNGLLYFVMPYVEGDSVRDLLKRDGALALEQAVHIVRNVADALDYAHARGVVHRDLKPENILLQSGQALLADFGVAHVMSSGVDDAGTITGVALTPGTPTYMSPEQASGDPELDRRSDIYSLGCVCFEMLSGAPPFRGPNIMAVIGQHLSAPPPALVGARGALPPGVPAAISKTLAKHPADRFPLAGDLATALERAMVDVREPSPADRRLGVAERESAARDTVLVLEFANITGAADADWLSTGIAETVASDLNKITRIKVVAQDAEMRRRLEITRQGRIIHDDVALELGRAANARWVVWGSFQKFGARIRIMPRFADTLDGNTAVVEKVDGVMDDIFDLQDRIVTAFASALQIQLSSGEVALIRQPETAHLRAYEHYANGWRAFLKFGKESVRTAAEHFRAAIAVDPDYAAACAGLGIIHGPMFIATGRPELLDEGIKLLERALALDASIGEAYAWLAYLQFRKGRFEDSEQTARRGIEREPTSFWCWYMLGAGRYTAAVALHKPDAQALSVPPLLRVLSLNPEYHAAYVVLAQVYHGRGEYGRAIPLADRGVELERAGAGLQFVGSFGQRASLHVGAGEIELARPLLEHAIARYAGADHVYAEVAHSHARWVLGCLEERAGRIERARAEFTAAYEIADANPHRIGIGAHWVKARFGLARALHHLGETTEAERAVVEAVQLFADRSRFVWTYVQGATDADVLYEQAATLASFGRNDQALSVLGRAVEAGWADAVWLRHDPAFAQLRDTPDVQRLCIDAAARVTLPPPVGRGGLE